VEAVKLPWETIVLGKASAYDTEGVYIGFTYVLYFQDGRVHMSEIQDEQGAIQPQGWYDLKLGDEHWIAVYNKVIQ